MIRLLLAYTLVYTAETCTNFFSKKWRFHQYLVYLFNIIVRYSVKFSPLNAEILRSSSMQK